MKKFLVLVLAFAIGLPSFAEIENMPVEQDLEIMLATFDDEGKLVQVTKPQTVAAEEAGAFELEIPDTFPEHKPIFVVVNDAAGEGTQQISYVDSKGEENAEIDSASTTAFNSFASMAKNTGLDPKDSDPSQMKEFFDDVEEALKGVPPDENPAKTMERMAQALSFNPEALLNAGGHFNVPKDKLVQVAANIEKAAAPSGFNPFEGLPEQDLSTIAPGSHTAGLLPEDYFKKHMPKEMQDFNKAFCETCPPPGGFEYVDENGKKGKIPVGTFMMPPGVKASSNVKFPDGPMFPPGVSIPKGFKMPAGAQLSPGVSLEEGFEAPEGMLMPPGVIKPEGFDAQFADRLVHQEEFTAPEGWEPPPGFAMTGKDGGFMMPPDFPFPAGTKVDEGLAFEFPQPEGFKAPKAPPGTEVGSFEPPEAGHQFPEGFKPPKGFDPEEHGFMGPPGFVANKFQPEHQDFTAFKSDDAALFDPFGGKFEHNADGTGAPFVPAGLQDALREEAKAKFGDEYDESKFQEFVSGSFDAAPKEAPLGTDGNHTGDGTTGEHQDPPPATEGEVVHQDPPPTTEGEVVHQDPPPTTEGEVVHQDPPPATLVKALKRSTLTLESVESDNDTRAKFVKLRKKSKKRSSSSTEVNAGLKLAVSIETTDKAKIITASEGVYLVGKAKAGKTAAQLPLLIDPSISASSVKVTVAQKDNEVNVETLTVDTDGATQLITTLDGTSIVMSTSGATDDLGLTKITGYLLAPGTSTLKLQKAITVKATVTDGTDGEIITFNVPAKKFNKLEAGVYTIVFQDGEDSYYGKVTIGTLKTRTVKGVVKAPNGSL